MAIIVKVEGDTEQLDQSIEKSADKAKSEFEKTGIGRAIENEQKKAKSAFEQIEADARKAAQNINGAFDTGAFSPGAQGKLDALQARMRALQGSIDGTLGSLKAVPATSHAAVLGFGGMAAVVGVLAGGLTAMAKAGAENAQKIQEQAKSAGKSVEEIQRLKVGTTDLTKELVELGGVLSKETIDKAAASTHQFSLLGGQVNALKIQVGSELHGAFTELGKLLNGIFTALRPAVLEIASVLNAIVQRIAESISKLAALNNWARENVPGYGTASGAVNTVATQTIPTIVETRFINQFRSTPVPTPGAASGLTAAELASILRTGRLPDGTLPRASGNLGPAPPRPAALPRIRGSAPGAAQSPDIPDVVQAEIDKALFSIQVANQNLNQLSKTELSTLEALDKVRTEQVILQAHQLEKSDRYLDLEQKRLELDSQIDEVTGRRLSLLLSGVQRDIKLPLGPKPGLEGPSLFVPGISQAQAQAPILQANEEARIAANNQRLLDELIDQYEHFRNRVGDVLFQAFDDGFRRGPGNFFTRTLASLRDTIARIALSNLADRIASAISPALFGSLGRGGATATGSGGGGLGGFLRGIISGNGGGGFGGFLTPPFNPNAGSQIAIPGSVSAGQSPVGLLNLGGVFGGTQIPGLGGGAAAAGKFSLSGLLGGLAPTFPLLGAGLGSALGGSSVPGKILGGIGGGILGATSAILATGSLFGLSIGLLTNPFTAIAGIGLLVGSALFGRAAQRKKDEKAADEIWVNEMNQIRQLISQVNSDRIDGQEALALAAQLRQQTIAGLNQIKTKSVRESRLTNQLRDLDNGVVAELKRAVERQATRQRIGPQLVPEFATGGRVPGIDQGFDSVIARLRPGEAVLNQSQIALLGGVSALRRARVPGFAEGGQITASTPSGGSNAGGPMTIIFEDVTIDAEGIFVKGARTSKGERVAVQIQRNARKNGRA